MKVQAQGNNKTLAKHGVSEHKNQNLEVMPQHLQSDLITQQAKLDTIPLTSHDVLQLQNTFGNRAVGQLITQRKLDRNISNNKTTDQGEERMSEYESHSDMPPFLKGGLEVLSGKDLSGVKIHDNSPNPSKLNALAYTQGQDIYIGPGQEKHLPHESWHVVQQMEGRVNPTMQMNGVSINDNLDLEREADVMGAKAAELTKTEQKTESPYHQEFIQSQQFHGQMSSTIQMVAPVLLGLTAVEIAEVIGVVTGVAAAVGTAATAQTGKSGMGDVLTLKFEKDYLMFPKAQAQLENITRALFFIEADKISSSNKSGDNQEDLRSTAIGNVKKSIISTLDSNATTKELTAVANGDGGSTKDKPWGSARVRLRGGTVFPGMFSENVYKSAFAHGISIDSEAIDYVKSCSVDYAFEKGGLVIDDEIWVRGVDMNARENDEGRMNIDCTVAFDWDADTSFYQWVDNTTITPGAIPRPKWKGPKDPDD